MIYPLSFLQTLWNKMHQATVLFFFPPILKEMKYLNCIRDHLNAPAPKNRFIVVLEERANSSWLNGVNILLPLPRAVAHSTQDPTVTFQMTHYYSWVTRTNKWRLCLLDSEAANETKSYLSINTEPSKCKKCSAHLGTGTQERSRGKLKPSGDS